MDLRRRSLSVIALALPAILLALVAFVFLSRNGDAPTGCPEVDVPLGDVVEGPRGWTAYGRYEQWPEAGHCLGSLGVSFFAPGESWEDEAWTPAAHVVVRSGLLPPPSRERAWLAWADDGRPLLLGFGAAGAPLIVDTMPDSPEGLSVRRCPVVDGLRSVEAVVDWSLLDGEETDCERLLAE